MYKVLHVTPHMSGGLGRVMLSTLKHSKTAASLAHHEIAVTDTLLPESAEFFSGFRDCIEDDVDLESLFQKIEQADIVQFEWWNHPLINKMLFLADLPPCRLILSSHVSGFARPQIINKNVAEFSDIFLATTKATRNHPAFQSESTRDKLAYITYPVDLDRFDNISFKAHNSFNVGYAGTIDYSKLHRSFLKMSSEVKIDEIQFIVCGLDENQAIEKESQQYRLGIFDFQGFQANIQSVFEQLDVFAYPLNDTHFGSGEQVIIEAMYVGLPVVAFANHAEKEIIRHNETGILVNSEQEYVEAIEFLYNNPSERQRIGQNARQDIIARLNPEACFKSLDETYRQLMTSPKTSHKLKPLFSDIEFASDDDECLGAKLFLESLGIENNQFSDSFLNRTASNQRELDDAVAQVEETLKVKAKGSMYQYLYFFKDDPYLNFWAGLLKKKDGDISAAIQYFKKASSCAASIPGIDHYLVELKE